MSLSLCEVSHIEAEEQKKKERRIFYTFCTISSLFPPWRPLSAECAEYAFHRQEAMEPARTKKLLKKGQTEKRLLLPLILQYRKMELLPRKPHHLVFFTFYPRVPGTLSYYYDQNTLTAHRLPTLTLKEKRKQIPLAAKCICLYFWSKSCLMCAHVEQAMAGEGCSSSVGRNIRTEG